MLKKIISGGQTGVDRGALDAALDENFFCGGWCPQGRRCEDGTLPLSYPLIETDSFDYEVRTEFNVRDSDATLIITDVSPSGGTALTLKFAEEYEKPYLLVYLNEDKKVEKVFNWINEHKIEILNVAGPRESKSPGVYKQSKDLVREIINKLKSL
jgi:hypothetical protein